MFITCSAIVSSAPIFLSKWVQAPTHQEFCCYCFIRRCLKTEAFLVLPRVRSQVNVRVRASTADDLIYQPDQAKGFRQDTQPGIVVTIPYGSNQNPGLG